MRRTIPAATALAAALLMFVPAASAAVEISDVDVYNPDSRQPLTRVPVGQPVLFIAQVTAAGAPYEGTVTLIFAITPADGDAETRMVTKTVNLTADETDELELVWTPRSQGAHTLEVEQDEPPGGVFTLTYTVAASSVPRASLVERTVEYGWFYGSFLGVLVLFVAVVRTRKPGP